MENIRSYFSFFLSYYLAIEELPRMYQLPVYRAICRYCLFGIEDVLQGVPKAIFLSFKPALDKNRIKSENAYGLKNKKTNGLQTTGDSSTTTSPNGSELEANNIQTESGGISSPNANDKSQGYNKEYTINKNNSKSLCPNSQRKGNKDDIILSDNSVSKYLNDNKW